MKDTQERAAGGESWAGDEVSLAYYLLVLWQYRLIIVLAALLGGAGAFAASRVSAPVYEATARLLASPPDRDEQAAQSPAGAAAAYAALLNNQSLVLGTLNDLGLTAPPNSLNPALFFAQNVTIAPAADTNILLVRVRLHDGPLAARVANRLSERALELARKISENDGLRARESYKAQMEDARAQVAEVERQLQELRRTTQPDSLQADVEALVDERKELLGLRLDIEAERARVRKATEELAREAPTRAARRTAEIGRTEDGRADNRPSEARPPEGGSLRDDAVSPYANPVYELLAQQVAAGKTRLAALEARLAALNREEANATRVNKLYAAKSEIVRLENELETASRVYSNAATRYQEARLRVAGLATRLQIIDAAVPPARPVAPRTLRNTVLGAGVAGLLVMIVVLVIGSIKAETPSQRARAAV